MTDKSSSGLAKLLDNITVPKFDFEPSQLSKDEEKSYESESSPDADAISEIKVAIAVQARLQEETKSRLLKLKVKREKQEITLRKKFADKAYGFVWFWSIAVLFLIFLSSSKSTKIEIFGLITIEPARFELSENVSIALITGVTVNILAVFLAVMRNLFPNKDAIKPKADEDTPD